MKKTDLEKIFEYYTEANKYLKIDEVKKACHILYTVMPVELYDKSIDLLFNRNLRSKSKNLALRDLIEEVDTKLCKAQGYFETEPVKDIFN